VSLSAIVFDFDGTIVESMSIKTDAFRRLFADYPDQVEQIVSLHLQHGGRSRYEKFEMIFRDILGRTPGADEFAALGRRFESLVADAVATCPFVPGASRFLEEFSSRVPLAVVSGTPHDELERILERRAIRSHFVEVHGSPPGKETILADMLRHRAWPAAEVLLVGDAMSDYQAARSSGVRFVGRLASTDTNGFPDGTTVIRDLSELPALLEIPAWER
jgi:phosphoglycolate phosphatase-like HAD superfamily hydrolase